MAKKKAAAKKKATPNPANFKDEAEAAAKETAAARVEAAHGGKVNKTELIRQAWAKHPTKRPKDIVTLIKEEHGVDVAPEAVSNWNPNKKKREKTEDKKPKGADSSGGKKAKKADTLGNGTRADSFAPMTTGIEFVKACGGLDAAISFLTGLKEMKGL